MQDNYGYEAKRVKLTDQLRADDRVKASYKSRYLHYKAYIKAGDKLCKDLQSKSAMVEYGLRQIASSLRTRPSPNGQRPKPYTYVIHSLKRPAEVERLREVWGSRFILLGVYQSRQDRIGNMANKLAESRHSHSARTETAHAIDLINLDERDEANDYGQRTAEAFAMSDIFLDCSTPVALSEQLRRNLRVVFSHPFETPHKDEVGMFHAAAASRRSASLDRQVGASLFRQDGTIIAVGCNEVPLAGGGQYWPSYMDQGHDNRQFQTGEDIGKAIQDILIGDIHRRLVSEKLIKDEYKNDRGVEKLRKALDLKKRGMERSRVLDLLEFKREVHAEMAAISDAARHGTLTRDAVLYTTVFPCHECTRHIVAAGIREVVYIEPYPKSMASKLHGDAVAVEELPCDGRVRFRPFVGISPQRYMDYFEAPERKAPKSRSCPAHGCTDLAFWSGNNQLLNIRPHEYGPCINAHLKVSCTKL